MEGQNRYLQFNNIEGGLTDTGPCPLGRGTECKLPGLVNWLGLTCWFILYMHGCIGDVLETRTFHGGCPASVSGRYNSEQCARLKMGFVPQEMEDKWFVYYDEPHLFFHRSWTGQPVYRLRLTSVPKGVEVTEALLAKNLADRSSNWDLAASPDWDSDYQVRLLDILVSNLLLGQAKSFPKLTGQTEPTQPEKHAR